MKKKAFIFIASVFIGSGVAVESVAAETLLKRHRTRPSSEKKRRGVTRP